MSDRRRVPENELSDSEDEGYGRRNERSYREKSLAESSLLFHDKEAVQLVGPVSEPSGSEQDMVMAKEEENEMDID